MTLVDHALTTTQRVKNLLGINDTSYDTLLDQLINSVTDWIESQTMRRFKRGTYSNEVYDGNGEKFLYLRQQPVISVSAAQYRSGSLSSPTWNDFNANDWELDTNRGAIYFPGKAPKGTRNLRFTYVAGYLIDFANATDSNLHTLPFDVSFLAERLVASAFNQRLAGGKKSEGLEGANIVWDQLVKPVDWEIINKYRRVVYA